MMIKLIFVMQTCSIGLMATIHDLSDEVVGPTTPTNATATMNMMVGASGGCAELGSSADANSVITKVTFKWTFRGVWNGHDIDHTGLEFETHNAKYALAYNSATWPGPYDSPGMVFCQAQGMPMLDMRANGNCQAGVWGCAGWQSGGSHSGLTGTTLAAFMQQVNAFGNAHPTYSFLACEPGSNQKANCQKAANHLYKVLTGSYPNHGGCKHCPSKCEEYEADETVLV